MRRELAHIRRSNTLFQTLCHPAKVVYWFHPLVWLINRDMRSERERACDDYVLAAGMRPSAYALELLEIASSLCRPNPTVTLAVARRSELQGRVTALLDPAVRRSTTPTSATVAAAVLTLFIALPLAALRPARVQNGQSAPIARTTAAPSTKDGSFTYSGRGQGSGYGSGLGGASSSSSSSVSPDF